MRRNGSLFAAKKSTVRREALGQAQTKLQSEEQGLVDGEARLAAQEPTNWPSCALLGIATRERFAIPVAVHWRTRCRRATAHTAQEFVLSCYRFGAHEPRPGGSDGAWDWTKSAFDERGEFVFESVGFKSARVQARYGMRGVRVGEASHSGPPSDSVALSTAIDSPTRIEHALEFDLTQQDSDPES